MACLEMYNNSTPSSHQQPSASPPMSPRISFSNDFVESHNNSNNLLLNSSRSSSQTPAPSSDFEFSVSNYNMMSADELFFKGRILPFSFKDNNNNNGSSNHTQMQSNRTLRDQLLVDDDHHDIFSLKPPKSSSSSSSSNGWKGFLGLRKSHIGSKKTEKIDSSFDSPKRFSFSHEDPNPKSSQGMVSNEGPSSTDMEMGV